LRRSFEKRERAERRFARSRFGVFSKEMKDAGLDDIAIEQMWEAKHLREFSEMYKRLGYDDAWIKDTWAREKNWHCYGERPF
jgi:hypothetical protein